MLRFLRLPTFLGVGLLRKIGPVAVMVLAVALISAAPAAKAAGDLANGGFETGDLTGWTTAGNVEVLSGSNFAPAITSPEGSYFALLSTGPGQTGSGDSGADRDGSGFNEFDIATLTQTFDITAPSSLSFTLAFATSEGSISGGFGFGPSGNGLWMDDIFEVLVDGASRVQGSVPGIGGSPFPDFGVLDSVDYAVSSSGSTNGSFFGQGITATAQYYEVLDPGSHTIEFFVGDEGDDVVDSGLIVDGLVLTPIITLDPPDATNDVGTDHTVTAHVEVAGDPIGGIEVTFEVTDGPNAGEVSDPGTGECAANDDCTTDGDGNVSWTYTGDGGAGTDTIQACTAVFLDVRVQAQEKVEPDPICAVAEKTWEAEPTPTPTPTPVPTATPTPTPVVAAAVALPDTGGAPSDGAGALPRLAAIAGAIAAMSAGGAWLTYQRRRVR